MAFKQDIVFPLWFLNRGIRQLQTLEFFCEQNIYKVTLNGTHYFLSALLPNRSVYLLHLHAKLIISCSVYFCTKWYQPHNYLLFYLHQFIWAFTSQHKILRSIVLWCSRYERTPITYRTRIERWILKGYRFLCIFDNMCDERTRLHVMGYKAYYKEKC